MAHSHKAANRDKGVLSAIPSILICLDTEGKVTRWNLAAETTFGIPEAQALGRSLEQIAISWRWETVRDGIEKCRQSSRLVRLDDIPFTRLDEKSGFIGMTIAPIQDEAADHSAFLIFGADVTERKLLESHLAHAQKLETIGQLAAGIAHEINTPIQYVGDNTRFIQDTFTELQLLLVEYDHLLQAFQAGQVSADMVARVAATAQSIDLPYLLEEIPKAIQQSLDGAARVAQIVRAMKEFSHPGTVEKVNMNINRAIESTVTVARNEWKYVAEVELDLEADLPPAPGLPGDLNQVFLNLIINAAHAIADATPPGSQEKGTIRVTTRQDKDWVEIRVQDTGTGIPEAIRSKVFDPFFTTKEVGRGTGQGLAISYSILEKHGGTIHFETEMGKGTTFILRLPLGEEMAAWDQAA
ncbi:MAG TPA: ATP-binding protein [Chthonomonadaceae bacterium]|nr:ATP-binding protein [Chthonomonadaceae bacterium]